MVMAELPELIVPDADAWRRWLADSHASPTGVWLVLAKKGTVEPTTREGAGPGSGAGG